MLPTERVELVVVHPTIETRVIAIEGLDREAARIEVAPLGNFWIDVSVTTLSQAQSFALIDGESGAAGRPLALAGILGNVQGADLFGGRTHVYAAKAGMHVLVLYGAGEELLRLPVMIAPGETTTLEP